MEQAMNADKLMAAGMTHNTSDILTGKPLSVGEDIVLDGYRYLWIDISNP